MGGFFKAAAALSSSSPVFDLSSSSLMSASSASPRVKLCRSSSIGGKPRSRPNVAHHPHSVVLFAVLLLFCFCELAFVLGAFAPQAGYSFFLAFLSLFLFFLVERVQCFYERNKRVVIRVT
jgi:hypothetical protein